MTLINFEELEEAIKNIEIILHKYNVEEKALILSHTKQRLAQRIQKLKTQEGLENLKFGNVIKKIIKQQNKKEDE